MSGVFDRLHGQIGKDDDGGTISPLDIMHLPDNQRTLVRMMLREVKLTREALEEMVGALPEDQHMTPQEFEEALNVLSQEGWLIMMGEEQVIYRVNLRHKPKAKSLWGMLDNKIQQTQDASKEAEGDEE